MTKNAHDLAKSFGYLTDKEVSALKTLAGMLPRNPSVLNIGAGAGTSGVAFLESRSDLTLHTIDIRQDSALGSLQSELNAIREAKIGNVRGRHYQYLGDSKKVLELWEIESWERPFFDLAFVDGSHTREGVRADIAGVLPLLKDGGIIVFDDYGNNPNGVHMWPEIMKAVDELIRPIGELVLHEDSVIAFRVKR